MGKKQKSGVDKVVKKVSDEFEKTSSQIEGLVNDAFRQFDNLQNQVHEPVKKLIEEMEALREREMKRFSDELERRLNDFREMQQGILERVGIASGKKGLVKKSSTKGATAPNKATSAPKSAKKAAGVTSAKKKTTAKSNTASPGKAAKSGESAKTVTARKSAAGQKSTAKKSPAKKSPAGKSTTAKNASKPSAPSQKKTDDENDLTRIKGIGPVTAEKMRAIGITSIRQIAAPSEADQKKLQEFAKMRGFDAWKVEANKLVA